MAFAEHIAMTRAFTTDLWDTENGGIPSGRVPSRSGFRGRSDPDGP